MATLLIRLQGPMQAWGTRSRFDVRDTEMDPSKSGVLGLVSAAMGIDRTDWTKLEPLTHLRMGTREDKPGILRVDYHTAQQIDDNSKEYGTSITNRYYMADAAFLVGLEGDLNLLQQIQVALKNPFWSISLGRKSFPPSEPVYFRDSEAFSDLNLEDALAGHSLLFECKTDGTEKHTHHLRFILEVMPDENISDGLVSRRNDQPIAAFSERKYRQRLVKTIYREVQVCT